MKNYNKTRLLVIGFFFLSKLIFAQGSEVYTTDSIVSGSTNFQGENYDWIIQPQILVHHTKDANRVKLSMQIFIQSLRGRKVKDISSFQDLMSDVTINEEKENFLLKPFADEKKPNVKGNGLICSGEYFDITEDPINIKLNLVFKIDGKIEKIEFKWNSKYNQSGPYVEPTLSSPQIASSEISPLVKESSPKNANVPSKLSNTQYKKGVMQYQGNGKLSKSDIIRLKNGRIRLNKLIGEIVGRKINLYNSAKMEDQVSTLKGILDFVLDIQFHQDFLDRIEFSTVNDLTQTLNELLEKRITVNHGQPEETDSAQYFRVLHSFANRMKEYKRNMAVITGYNPNPQTLFYANLSNELTPLLISPSLPSTPMVYRDTLFAIINAWHQMSNGQLDSLKGYTVSYRDQGLLKGTIHSIGVPTTPSIGRMPYGDWYIWLTDSKTKKQVSDQKEFSLDISNDRNNPAVEFLILQERR